jgi:hypothetical protein
MLGLGNNILRVASSDAAAIQARSSAFSNTKSLSFDGTNDYVDTNYNPTTLFRGSFSISFWTKPDDGQPSANMGMIGVEKGLNQNQVIVLLNTDGVLSVFHASNGRINYGATNAAVFTNGAQSDFKHIVITEEKVSGGNAALKLYVNGTDTALSILGGGFLVIPEADFEAFNSAGLELNIGAVNDDGTQDLFYDGLIDEFAAFAKPLSSSEVTSIYNSGVPKDETSHARLSLYYRFEDNVNDTDGTSNGTNNGATFSSTVPS